MSTVWSMSKPQVPPNPIRAAQDASSLLSSLCSGTIARTSPLLQKVQAASEAELSARRADGEDSAVLADALVQAGIVRSQITAYERSWQKHVSRAFEGWPKPAASVDTTSYALLSDVELDAQLVGQPVSEALERRFVDILEVIDSRLWTLAASMGAGQRPLNPVGPRMLVQHFLATFPAGECEETMRMTMLRHFERSVFDAFGDTYDWFNKQLTDAGIEMSRATDYAMLMAGPQIDMSSRRASVDGVPGNVLAAQPSSWRGSGDALPRRNIEVVRRDLLHARIRARHGPDGDGILDPSAREMGDEELLAILALLQGEQDELGSGRLESGHLDDFAAHLQESVRNQAMGLGMDLASTPLARAQSDAINVIGALFQELLTGHSLGDAGSGRLSRLVSPYLRLSLSTPTLFEPPEHPALSVLSLVVRSLDGNDATNPVDAQLQLLAIQAAEHVLADYNGNDVLFEQMLTALQDAVEGLQSRAQVAADRTAKAIDGRERLSKARRTADELLRERLESQPLLASTAQFLSDHWRQSMLQALLRSGPESPQFIEVLGVADTILGIDQGSASASGSSIADALIAAEQSLRQCYAACGLADGGADEQWAMLVGELSRPESPRAMRAFIPFHDPVLEPVPAPQSKHRDLLVTGQDVLWHREGSADQLLHLAWISPQTNRYLLVDRQGVQTMLLASDDLAESFATGTLRPRAQAGPVESAIQRLLAGDGQT